VSGLFRGAGLSSHLPWRVGICSTGQIDLIEAQSPHKARLHLQASGLGIPGPQTRRTGRLCFDDGPLVRKLPEIFG
jgi:hypothetical protein